MLKTFQINFANFTFACLINARIRFKDKLSYCSIGKHTYCGSNYYYTEKEKLV